MELKDNEKEFLIGLEALTRKTGIAIGGCGCCGSPFLFDAEINSDKSGYAYGGFSDIVTWVDPSDKYDWEKYSDLIIKQVFADIANV